MVQGTNPPVPNLIPPKYLAPTVTSWLAFFCFFPLLKLTFFHLKIDPWKRRFLLESTIFRGYVTVSFREGSEFPQYFRGFWNPRSHFHHGVFFCLGGVALPVKKEHLQVEKTSPKLAPTWPVLWCGYWFGISPGTAKPHWPSPQKPDFKRQHGTAWGGGFFGEILKPWRRSNFHFLEKRSKFISFLKLTYICLWK